MKFMLQLIPTVPASPVERERLRPRTPLYTEGLEAGATPLWRHHELLLLKADALGAA